jgi:hypothetical protein
MRRWRILTPPLACQTRAACLERCPATRARGACRRPRLSIFSWYSSNLLNHRFLRAGFSPRVISQGWPRNCFAQNLTAARHSAGITKFFCLTLASRLGKDDGDSPREKPRGDLGLSSVWFPQVARSQAPPHGRVLPSGAPVASAGSDSDDGAMSPKAS